MIAARLLAITALIAGFGAAPATAQEAPVVVDADQFHCLSEKIAQVRSEPKGIYVNIRNCRSGGLRFVEHLVPPPRQVNEAGVESLLYLKPAQIRCIARNRRTLDRIAAPAGPGRLRLKLEPCGR